VIDSPQTASVVARLPKIVLLLPFLTAALAQGVIVDHWTNENGLPVNSIRGSARGPKATTSGWPLTTVWPASTAFASCCLIRAIQTGFSLIVFFRLVRGRDGAIRSF